MDTPVALDEGDVMLVRAPEGSPNLSGFCQTWADGNQHHSFDIRGRVDMAGDVTRLLQKQGAVEALPAYCFVRMFTPTVAGQYGLEDCSGAYVGDVTANGQSVFSRMFEGCTSLTKAPRWGKVSILGESAYTFQYCFYNCSNLTEAQDVFDASGTGNYTFQSMFENCTSLLHGPQLGSGAVDCGGRYSHQSAFKGCTAMTSAGPVVQIDRCWRWKYEQMFRGCTSLEEPPEMRVSDGSQYAFQYMFADCTSLKRTASFRLGGYHDGFNSAFASMYVNCASLTSITEMPVPPDWSGGNAQNYLYVNMFSGCSSLVDASDVVLSPYLNQYSMCAMFKNCTSLEKPPQFYAPISGMFQNAMQEMFMGCASLTSTPAIDETAVQSVSNDSHNGMFTGCSALVDASGIKLSEVATVHGNRCYY